MEKRNLWEKIDMETRKRLTGGGNGTGVRKRDPFGKCQGPIQSDGARVIVGKKGTLKKKKDLPK